MTPNDQMRKFALASGAAQVPVEIQKFIAAQAIESQKSILAFPYYSTARFSALAVTNEADATSTYTVLRNQQETCFNYKIGDVAPQSGFASGFSMTDAETNLLQASSTRDNADVLIHGIAIELCSDSPAGENEDVTYSIAQQLVRALWRNVSCQLSLSGTETHLLGVLSHFPSGGGLYGAMIDSLYQPALDGAAPVAEPFPSNGNPMAGNFYRFPSPLLWRATGSGKKDTSLVITFTNRHEILLSSTARAAGTGIVEFVRPEAIACDLRVRLAAVQVSDRSSNT